MYVCGWNGNGQLGVGHVNNVDVPIPISGLQQQIVKVACGWNHTMAITSTLYVALCSAYVYLV